MVKFYKPFILASGVFLLAVLMQYVRTGLWHTGGMLMLLLLYMAGIVLAPLVQAVQSKSSDSLIAGGTPLRKV